MCRTTLSVRIGWLTVTWLVLGLPISGQAQPNPKPRLNHLVHVGLIGGLMGGMYDGWYPLSNVIQHGDFGIAAPDSLDGEVTILHGRIYHFTADGKTRIRVSGNTPFAAAHFFAPDTTFPLRGPVNRTQLNRLLDVVRSHENTPVGIRMTGTMAYIHTRAIPGSVVPRQKPYPPATALLKHQRLFERRNIRGTLVGYWMPPYLAAINIPGYHFHFVAYDLSLGGHVTDVILGDVTVELDQLHTLEVLLPNTPEFRTYRFPQNLDSTLNRVERGG